MKKIHYISIFVLAIIIISCEKQLDAPAKSSLEAGVIFSTYDLARGAVDGIKMPMQEVNSYRGRFLPYYGMNTDVEWWNTHTANDKAVDLTTYTATVNNGNMNTADNAYGEFFSGIEKANLCIQGLREYGNPEPGTKFGELLGEAIVLRAIYYTDLLKAWGDVPERFEPISAETLYLGKTSRDIIYDRLIEDLKEAADLVPEMPSSNVEIAKPFVKGLRARLCLITGGYSQYPDGIKRRDNWQSYYQEALKDLTDVMAMGISLEPKFEDIFIKNCQYSEAPGESMWEIPLSNVRGRMAYHFAIEHTKADQHTNVAQGGDAGPLPYVFYDYDVADIRRDVSCIPYEWGSTVDGVAKQELRSLDNWCFGKWRYEWIGHLDLPANDDGVRKIYMRYAEIILMRAEVENELNGPAAAAPYLTMIRQRAFKQADWQTKVTDYVNAASASKDAMFNAIVDEQAFEFCGEMQRKQALIRWNLLKTKLDEAKAKMYALRDRIGEYSDVPTILYYNYVDGKNAAGTVFTGTDLEIYGLNRGEISDMSASYNNMEEWVKPSAISNDDIEAIYYYNPDQRQFWPIWQVFLDNSNGKLVNDYGY